MSQAENLSRLIETEVMTSPDTSNRHLCQRRELVPVVLLRLDRRRQNRGLLRAGPALTQGLHMRVDDPRRGEEHDRLRDEPRRQSEDRVLRPLLHSEQSGLGRDGVDERPR